MVNKSKWIYNYSGLDPDNQLIVAEAIANELRDNEIVFDEDEYDHEKSRIVRKFFVSIKNNAKVKEEFKKFADVFERYENLSQENRKKVINEIFEIIVKYLGVQEQENKANICNEEGHIFGKWRKMTWTTEEVYWDAGPRGYVDVEHNMWERTCSRCGFVDTANSEYEKRKKKIKEMNKG